MQGRLWEIAKVADAQNNDPSSRSIEMVLTKLFAGDHDGFVAWIGEQTKALAHVHDLAMRDADLETVIKFMQAKVRRTRSFTTPEPSVIEKRVDLEVALLLTEESGNQP